MTKTIANTGSGGIREMMGALSYAANRTRQISAGRIARRGTSFPVDGSREDVNIERAKKTGPWEVTSE